MWLKLFKLLDKRILNQYGIQFRQGSVLIKASSFHNKPTLKYLQERFSLNEAARQKHKSRVKNAIDLAFLKQPNQSLQILLKTLEKEGINTVIRRTLRELFTVLPTLTIRQNVSLTEVQ
jgi:hypothetical protein